MKSEDSLKQAFKRAATNILQEGTSDVGLVGRPFEADLLSDASFQNKLRQKAVREIIQNDLDKLEIGTPNHILVPKKSLADFRSCAVTDIYDELVYLTLVLSIAKSIETNRINKSKDTVFSYRLKYDELTGRLFDPNYSFSSFQSHVHELKRSSSYRVMVKCDIASFYDRLNLHRLNSSLLSLPNVDNDIANLIDKLLLFWSGRNSYGLPVGSNASRILAEAELITVDNYLIQHGVKFCRFVDDYRIFAQGASEANESLERLVFALEREGLFLNSGKTKIEDISATEQTNPAEPQPCVPAGRPEEPKQAVLIAGYSGLIPLKYRAPSSGEALKLLSLDIQASLKKAEGSVLLESHEFRDLLKSVQVQERFECMTAITPLVEKCPQFIPYVIDFCQKNARLMSPKARESIADYFEKSLLDNNTPEYIRIAISGLYATPDFERMDILAKTFLGLSRESGKHIGRVLLDRMTGRTSRLTTLDIRDNCSTANVQELRSLARLVARGLPKDESAPFLKNLRIRSNDPFLEQVIATERKRLKSI